MFSQQQETIIVNMVLQNNLIRLREIQQRVEEDKVNFEGINSVNLSTTDRVLKRNLISLKQAYRVPFERNSERRMFQLDSMEMPHECIFLDEAGFNLTKRKRRGCNIIGQHAIVELPGQRGGNMTICAAISSYGVIHRDVTLGPYSTAHLIMFLHALQEALLRREQRGDEQAEHPMKISFSQWMQHVTTLEWKRFKVGFGMLKDSFPVA
ncbi:uncharacterized protein LOC123959422 isoform X2 [Micropterus dolomieu]|uniref:uncharacterized protein LOC123959422 isoform X2 n=1 Tax=Micropterus dolomieu TaxID=147949 RepID=UPI001E8EB9A4|nr:uncharacterized protein LOC123959422 isoform X2 [Micropterus dolomieu]